MAENELLLPLWDEPVPDAKPSVLTSTTEQQTMAGTLNRAWQCLPGLEMQLPALLNCQKGSWVLSCARQLSPKQFLDMISIWSIPGTGLDASILLQGLGKSMR